MLMEFLCLFFLGLLAVRRSPNVGQGIIQQLLECVSLQVDETKTLQCLVLLWTYSVYMCEYIGQTLRFP